MKAKKTQQAMLDVCELLFQQIEKPAHFDRCKAVNVYDNRYRINLYTKTYDELYDVYRIKIAKSYFAHLNDGELVIKM